MFFEENWQTLTPTRAGSIVQIPIASLDVSILQDRLLGPVLGIGDPRTDPRIDFVGGIRGTGELEERVRSGRGRRRVLDVPDVARRGHGDRGRRRHDAAEVHVVRAEAALRPLRTPILRFAMKVLVADKFEESGLAGLKALGCEVLYEPKLEGASLGARLAETGAEVLVVRSTKVGAAEMESASGLALIVRAGAGVNTIDLPAASARAIAVSNCPGKNAIAVAELAWGLILALDRRLVEQAVDLRDGVWNKSEYGKARGLAGRTLGVIGLGAIGLEVVARAKAFGMPIVAWSRSLDDDRAARLGVARADSIHALAAASDVVTVHCALTKETKGMLDAKFFAAMKPGAFFVNTSRGEVVDQPALEAAIAEKGLRAGLDVFAKEPAGGTGAFEDGIVKSPRGHRHAPRRRLDRAGAERDRGRDRADRRGLRLDGGGPERRQPREPHAGDARPVRPAPRPCRRPRARVRRAARGRDQRREDGERRLRGRGGRVRPHPGGTGAAGGGSRGDPARLRRRALDLGAAALEPFSSPAAGRRPSPA